jgi:hypothetical protein
VHAEKAAALAERHAGGRYEILEPIGAGGYAAVFKARNRENGRLEALKIMTVSSGSDPDAVQRFREETRIATGLDHPSIVRVFASGGGDDALWYAMELVEGPSLSAGPGRPPRGREAGTPPHAPPARPPPRAPASPPRGAATPRSGARGSSSGGRASRRPAAASTGTQRPRASPRRSRTPSRTAMRRASSTATSSPRTSSSLRTERPSSWTSGSPSPKTAL